MSKSIGTLWTVPQQLEGKRIRAVAAWADLELELGTGYTHFETNRTPEFEAKFSSGKIPALETKDGLKLFESTAIARYVASLNPSAGLLGSNAKEAALIDQWVSFSVNHVAQHNAVINQFIRGVLKPYVKALDTNSRERLIQHLAIIEKHLQTQTFLVGHRITLADITLASILIRSFALVLDPETRKSHPNVVRHFETVINQPKLKDIFGQVEYIDKQAQYVAPKKEKEEK